MMEVKDGLEGEVALTAEFGLRRTLCLQWRRRVPAGLGVLLHDMHDHHTLPPQVPNPMHVPYGL